MGLGHCRPKANRLPKMPDRLFEAAQVEEGVAEVAVGFGITRPPPKRMPELPLRFVELASLFERIAEIVVGFHMVRIKLDGPPVMRFGLAHATERM